MADVARGVSTALGYTMNVAVATLLVTGLLVAAGGVVQDERQRAIRTELTVIGERIAADLAAADRLARTGNPELVRVTVTVPRRVANAPYTVAVNQTGANRVVLSTRNPDVEVSVPFRSVTPVAAARVGGGSLTITYNETADKLEVTDE